MADDEPTPSSPPGIPTFQIVGSTAPFPPLAEQIFSAGRQKLSLAVAIAHGVVVTGFALVGTEEKGFALVLLPLLCSVAGAWAVRSKGQPAGPKENAAWSAWLGWILVWILFLGGLPLLAGGDHFQGLGQLVVLVGLCGIVGLISLVMALVGLLSRTIVFSLSAGVSFVTFCALIAMS